MACSVAAYLDFSGELLNHFGGELKEAKTAGEENYCGCYKLLADYAQELTEETTQIPENLIYYIDYERMGRDMEMSGDIFTLESHSIKSAAAMNPPWRGLTLNRS